MKKTTLPAFISTAIVCYIFWLLITGQIPSVFTGGAQAEILIAGAIVSVIVAAFSARFFIHGDAFYLFQPGRLLRLLAYCFGIFPKELIKANWDVARRALSPKLPVDPGIVKIPTELTSEYGLSMLGNSITLTPGTITMDIADEGEGTNLYIHWIDIASEDPEEAGEAIKGTLERGIRRIFR